MLGWEWNKTWEWVYRSFYPYKLKELHKVPSWNDTNLFGFTINHFTITRECIPQTLIISGIWKVLIHEMKTTQNWFQQAKTRDNTFDHACRLKQTSWKMTCILQSGVLMAWKKHPALQDFQPYQERPSNVWKKKLTLGSWEKLSGETIPICPRIFPQLEMRE